MSCVEYGIIIFFENKIENLNIKIIRNWFVIRGIEMDLNKISNIWNCEVLIEILVKLVFVWLR